MYENCEENVKIIVFIDKRVGWALKNILMRKYHHD